MSLFVKTPMSFCLVPLLCLVCALADHHERPTEPMGVADPQHMKLLYGSTANMTCADEYFNPDKTVGVRYQWVLPSGEVLSQYESDASDGKFRLENNGSALTIANIEREDFGVYYCLVITESDLSIFSAIRWGINVDGPYFGDLSGKYAPRLQMGLVAGIVVFLVMSMFCYNYDTYQDRHDKGDREARIDMEMSMQPYLKTGVTRSDMEMAHINPAFESDKEEKSETGPGNETTNGGGDGGNGGADADTTDQQQSEKDGAKTAF